MRLVPHITVTMTVLLVMRCLVLCDPARACGFGEAPGGCGDDAKNEARYLLHRVVQAVQADEAKALQAFTRGEDGFRTVDSYVFCVGPDGVMSAHPNPILRGHDVRELHDQTGNYFIAAMLKTAKPDQVDEIHYLFPRPGGTEAIPKTTYYTRVSDQVCAVGVYDGDDTPNNSVTPTDRLRQLREKLNAEMPPNIRADWTAFGQALDEQNSAQSSAVQKAREELRVVGDLLDGTVAH